VTKDMETTVVITVVKNVIIDALTTPVLVAIICNIRVTIVG